MLIWIPQAFTLFSCAGYDRTNR